jgi:hypothetical protein
MSVVGRKDEAGRFPPPGLEIAVGGFALLLLGGALAADQAWFDGHFLPIFAVSHAFMTTAEQSLRGFVILSAVIPADWPPPHRPASEPGERRRHSARGFGTRAGIGDGGADIARSSAASP